MERGSYREKNELLTQTELNVIRYISQGKGTKEIAELIGYTFRGTERLRARMYKRLKVINGIQAVMWAYEKGLLSKQIKIMTGRLIRTNSTNRLGEMVAEGKFYDKPRMGSPFSIGVYETLAVTKLLDNNKFETPDGTYQILLWWDK